MDMSPMTVAENVRRTCEGIAVEIAVRTKIAMDAAVELPEDLPLPPLARLIEQAALAVLLDWFLGDFVPLKTGRAGDDDG